jgi:hypothetical protein
MNCRLLAVTFAALTPMAPGCERTRVSKRAPAFQSMTMQLSSLAGAPQRFIAERDKLEIIAPESELQKSWASAIYLGCFSSTWLRATRAHTLSLSSHPPDPKQPDEAFQDQINEMRNWAVAYQ